MIANTGDDVEVYGVHVSPDPDLVAYWLADVIDERGFGLRGDSFEVMAALARAGVDTWFQLGDRDLAMCLLRTSLLRGGARLTEAHAAVVEAVGAGARVLPMADEPVRTRVLSDGRRLPFQEYMIVEGASAPVDAVELEGVSGARPTQEVLAALAGADAIVIGPSNPVASIGPILALPGMTDALSSATAPVIAVSPFVGGRAVKGPTERFCASAGIALSAQGVADHYGGLVDAVVADEAVEGLPARVMDTGMDVPAGRIAVADAVLALAASLS